MYLQKVISRKNCVKKLVFCWHLEGHWRIHPKMSWIRNNAFPALTCRLFSLAQLLSELVVLLENSVPVQQGGIDLPPGKEKKIHEEWVTEWMNEWTNLLLIFSGAVSQEIKRRGYANKRFNRAFYPVSFCFSLLPLSQPLAKRTWVGSDILVYRTPAWSCTSPTPSTPPFLSRSPQTPVLSIPIFIQVYYAKAMFSKFFTRFLFFLFFLIVLRLPVIRRPPHYQSFTFVTGCVQSLLSAYQPQSNN